MLVHQHVEQEDYFRRDYPAIVEHFERETLRGEHTSQVSQVTFFRCSIPRRCKRIPRYTRKRDVLATVVLITTRSRTPSSVRTFVFEAVVTRPALAATPNLPNYYYHVFSDIAVHVAGRKFDMKAAYFVQQNGNSTVCAHVALQMALFHVEKGDTETDPEPTTAAWKINEIVKEFRAREASRLGVPRPPAFRPSDGLSVSDIGAVLRAHGLSWYVLDTRAFPEISAYNFAYLLVESGIPTLIAFAHSHPLAERDLHVIHAIGHTTNYDEWLPMALATGKYQSPSEQDRRYISSAYWAPHLIIHDDILGPYHCLGAGDLTFFSQDIAKALLKERQRWAGRKGATSGAQVLGEDATRIRYVVGIVPQSLKSETLTPYLAEQLAFGYLEEAWSTLVSRLGRLWRGRLANVSLNQLVLRTQLVGRDRYIKHIQELRDHDQNSATRGELATLKRNLSEKLPDRFWVTEFSLPDLFSVNRSKLGEVIVDFSPSPASLGYDAITSRQGPCLGIRICGEVQLKNAPAFRLSLSSHTPLIRRNELPALEF